MTRFPFAVHALLTAIGLFVVSGCNPGPPKVPNALREKLGEATRVTGELVLDGSPATDVIVRALNEKDLPEEMQWRNLNSKVERTIAVTGTLKDGKILFTTYEYGDGLPQGSYILLFLKYIPREGSHPKLEAFNKEYGDPQTSKTKFTVDKGKPVDLGTIELKSP